MGKFIALTVQPLPMTPTVCDGKLAFLTGFPLKFTMQEVSGVKGYCWVMLVAGLAKMALP